VAESPRYIYYLETKRERTWNNYFRGDIHFLFTRFYVSAGVSLTDARERWNYEIDIRPRHKEQGLQGTVLWQPLKKTSFSLGYRRAKFDYENLEIFGFRIGDQLNHDETFVNAGAYYQLSFRMRAFADLEYGRFDFQNPLNPRDSESGAVYGGFEFSPLGKIRGRVRLGYKYFRALKEGMPDYRGLVGDSGVSVSLLKNLTLRGSYGRNVQFSVWTDTNQYIENSTGAGVSFYLFRRKVRLDYDFTFNDNFYPPPKTAGPAGSGERRDRMWVNLAGVYFRLKKNIGLGLTIGQWHRESDIYRWKANRNFLGLNLTYDF
jgi:hypothetical protein